MAPGALGDSCADLIARARDRWTEKSIVYTRRNHKKAQKSSINNDAPASVADNPASAVTTAVTSAKEADNGAAVSPPLTTGVCHAPEDSGEAAVMKDKGDCSVQEPAGRPEASSSLATDLQNPEDVPLLETIISEGGRSEELPKLN